MARVVRSGARSSMDRAIIALQMGDIDFARFYNDTAPQWARYARQQTWRFRDVVSIDADDVAQEMVITVPASVSVFDDTLTTMTLRAFVLWRAFKASAKCLRQHRTIALDPGEYVFPPAQEDYIHSIELRDRLCTTLLEHRVFDALLSKGGSLKAIADTLEEDPLTNPLFEDRRAYTVVRTVTRRFASRAALLGD